MANAIYAGSFDPFTNGHLHVLKQAVELFDKVIIVMAVNPDKNRRINESVMFEAILETLKIEKIENVHVIKSDDLVAVVAAQYDCEYLIRGIRNGADFEYEENLAKVNEKLNKNLKTIYFRAGKTDYISSSTVMLLNKYNINISEMVPQPIYEILKSKNYKEVTIGEVKQIVDTIHKKHKTMYEMLSKE